MGVRCVDVAVADFDCGLHGLGNCVVLDHPCAKDELRNGHAVWQSGCF